MTTQEPINFALSPDDAQKMAQETVQPVLLMLQTFRDGLLKAGFQADAADRMCEQMFTMMLGKLGGAQ
jgi:hypothetical protein